MGTVVKCAKCGSTDFDLTRYESMMVLCSQLALFTLRCPRCSSHVAALCVIPPELQADVRRAALEVGAGMGSAAAAGSPTDV